MCELKVCKICGEEKCIEEMTYRGKSKVTGLPLRKNFCKKCDNKAREIARKANMTPARIEANKRRQLKYDLTNPNGRKNKRLLNTYGISLADYNQLLEQQSNQCAICGKEEKLYIDHCHTEGQVRGLLCNGCNTALGLFKEDIEVLEKAKKYILENKK